MYTSLLKLVARLGYSFRVLSPGTRILLPTECVTREHDPLSLWGPLPVHTRSCTLSLRWLFNQTNPLGVNGQVK